jgi:hypothetical protein
MMIFKPTVGNKLYEVIRKKNHAAANLMDSVFKAAFARSTKPQDWKLHDQIDGEIICVAFEILEENQ